MQILVLGGAGFIGTNLCIRLLGDGHTVWCMDTLSTGSRANIQHLAGNKNFCFVQHDIRESFKDYRNCFDRIYNLACPASPTHYQFDPIKTWQTSVLGAMNLLEWTGSSVVLQASTSEVYGDPLVQPQSENYWGNVNPIGIRSCYDEGKRAAESLFFDYSRQRGTRIRVIRIFNTYGPYMAPNDGRVIPNFITQALRDENITLHGNGSQTRAFCYVDDLIDGMILMMNSDHAGPINLGNPEGISMGSLARLIIDLTGSKSQVINLPMPSDDPVHRCPDISKAKRLLGWEPGVELLDGLKKTISYFKGL